MIDKSSSPSKRHHSFKVEKKYTLVIYIGLFSESTVTAGMADFSVKKSEVKRHGIVLLGNLSENGLSM